jgi:hypothetical protein
MLAFVLRRSRKSAKADWWSLTKSVLMGADSGGDGVNETVAGGDDMDETEHVARRERCSKTETLSDDEPALTDSVRLSMLMVIT